ncbi:ribosomal-processing cysteine protease Prp [Enterococcus faecalis]|uniref:ribosomal-processing cysteine protease Prp n=1 Tax=Enterococcus faecalis TaxID=1351 RepID=UPI00067DA3D9|nr:ribosomal-processing cysteine protease Prp [Enterococcus faecalis]
MIVATFKKMNNSITEYTIEGHAQFDEEGKDIVCAAVSSIAIAITNELQRHTEISIIHRKGYLSVKLYKQVGPIIDVISRSLTNCLISHMKEIAAMYPENVITSIKSNIDIQPNVEKSSYDSLGIVTGVLPCDSIINARW